jgi:NADPH:quinone reductase-like Zn-dependent oxidoreductase
LNGARSVLDLIGSTPVVKLKALPGKNDAEVWAKLESFNPGGSVKDRICLNMIETAERQGKLKPHVSTTLPLDRAREALEMMALRKVIGKVVLIR